MSLEAAPEVSLVATMAEEVWAVGVVEAVGEVGMWVGEAAVGEAAEVEDMLEEEADTAEVGCTQARVQEGMAEVETMVGAAEETVEVGCTQESATVAVAAAEAAGQVATG